MASATIIVTKRNIAERKAKIKALRATIRATPRGAARQTLLAQLQQLMAEVATLKASLYYYLPPGRLAQRIARQRAVVDHWTAKFHAMRGPQAKLKVGKKLRREAKELEQMLAAAKMQQVQSGLQAPLPLQQPVPGTPAVAPATTEAQTAAANPILEAASQAEDLSAESIPEGAQTFEPSDFSIEAPPVDVDSEGVLAQVASGIKEVGDDIEAEVDALSEYKDKKGEVWYKNPLVIAAAGGLIYLAIRNR